MRFVIVSLLCFWIPAMQAMAVDDAVPAATQKRVLPAQKGSAAGQPPAAPAPAKAAVEPAKYRVEMVSVFGARPKEEFLVVVFPGGGFAFKTLDSLKTFVATLPHGSSLVWAPSCSPPQPASPLATGAQVREFEEYCKEKGIQFVRLPSG